MKSVLPNEKVCIVIQANGDKLKWCAVYEKNPEHCACAEPDGLSFICRHPDNASIKKVSGLPRH